jgi:Na+(H+)/acetate symporter ActP
MHKNEAVRRNPFTIAKRISVTLFVLGIIVTAAFQKFFPQMETTAFVCFMTALGFMLAKPLIDTMETRSRHRTKVSHRLFIE